MAVTIYRQNDEHYDGFSLVVFIQQAGLRCSDFRPSTLSLMCQTKAKTCTSQWGRKTLHPLSWSADMCNSLLNTFSHVLPISPNHSKQRSAGKTAAQANNIHTCCSQVRYLNIFRV